MTHCFNNSEYDPFYPVWFSNKKHHTHLPAFVWKLFPLFPCQNRKGLHFLRVVCQQSKSFHSQILQNLGAYVIFSLILFKSQCNICLNGVHPPVLQFICPKFIDQAYSPSFLSHIQEDTPSLFFNLRHCSCILFTAITSGRTKSISGQTFRMHPAQYVLAI